ncbi:STAS domain-containing protein [Streptomyces fuscigenes]|uniref:STAS domain-containing protein n=1 Tax=Streptomyces fuscigenes TaxID=1528880 RepID=UPI001F1CC18B|nr:STAS domain-containing protein [Streptomyces fuscigenes]MCF3961866.1 STAS domain-containing protein [Streptomyces fuscigenes]
MLENNSAAVVTRTTDNGGHIVRATGSLDDENASLLEDALEQADREQSRMVVVDLSGVSFADSTVLHVLLQARRRSRRLVIAGPLGGVVLRLFEATGTRSAFTFAPTVEAALAL